MIRHSFRIKTKGFTLVEILVSVSLYSFVALVAIASLVSSTQLNNKLKVTRNLYDNMYFTIEELSRELKQGSNYQQTSTSEIILTPYQTGSVSFYRHRYILVGGVIKMQRDNGSGTFVDISQLTSDSIRVNTLKFEIIGGGSYASGDRQQPSVKILISGTTKESPISNFNLESIITQRDTDI